jgi:hypothetical protein
MSNIGPTNIENFDLGFTFESYGVRIRVESNSGELLDESKRLAERVMLGNFKIIENGTPAEHKFVIGNSSDGQYLFGRDDEFISAYPKKATVLEVFVRLLRIKISEFAVGRVFLHAGVVAWKDRAIVIPANSAKGKTTLVIELVKLGAVYYSDEYAVLDAAGLAHPFARELSVREEGRVWQEKDGTPVERFGGVRGTRPVPVAMVLITEFDADAVWDPERLSPGEGIMEIIPHTLPLRHDTEFSLNVLKNAFSRAIILRGLRGEAAETAKNVLSFFENNID